MARIRGIIVFFVCLIGLSQCQRPDRWRLTETLFSDYNPYVRPDGDDGTVNVDFGVMLYQVIGFDRATSQAKFSLGEYMRWTDETLRWDPEEFGGVDVIRVPASHIWIPDIKLFERITMEPEVDRDVNAIVNASGSVIYVQPSVRTVTCLQEDNDPYTAYCNLRYGSWTFEMAKLDIFPTMSDGVGLTEANMGTDWVLHSSSVNKNFLRFECCPETYPNVAYHLVLKWRRHQTKGSHQ